MNERGAGISATLAYEAELRRRRVRLIASAAAAAAGAGMLAAGWMAGAAPDIRVPTLVAGAALLVAALVLRPEPDPERWLRGAAGEEATAALLERLSRRRFYVAHDRGVPGSRANIDHVVIGSGRVWVIDSKAYRAPLRGGWRSVWVGGRRVGGEEVRGEEAAVAD
ncbi:MAG: nuclease-related domain-containing protein, partial [Acidimicrobiales bacterium]